MSKMKKPKSLRPPMPIVTPNTSLGSQESDMQFELELCWCVQQMENTLNSGKLSQKVAEDTQKNLKILKGKTAPIIKKRQVMKAAMGDYRAKMREEEKKMSLASKQIKFTSSADAAKKSNFVKKSAILTSGKDFKFNFNTAKEVNDASDNENVNINSYPEAEVGLGEVNKFNASNINLTSGGGFMFNFPISELNDELGLSELSIKN